MFTWNETVALYLVQLLCGNVDMTLYLINILKPMRRCYIEEEAREWHQSLRISKEDRWHLRKMKGLKASVPITCTLPIDGEMWRNSKELIKSLNWFYGSFIRKRVQLQIDGSLIHNAWENAPCHIGDKIRVVNRIHRVSKIIAPSVSARDGYLSEWSITQIHEAYFDHELFIDETNQWNFPDRDPVEYEDLPYIYERSIISENSSGEFIHHGDVLEIAN
jgi:hypothetical protein